MLVWTLTRNLTLALTIARWFTAHIKFSISLLSLGTRDWILTEGFPWPAKKLLSKPGAVMTVLSPTQPPHRTEHNPPARPRGCQPSPYLAEPAPQIPHLQPSDFVTASPVPTEPRDSRTAEVGGVQSSPRPAVLPGLAGSWRRPPPPSTSPCLHPPLPVPPSEPRRTDLPLIPPLGSPGWFSPALWSLRNPAFLLPVFWTQIPTDQSRNPPTHNRVRTSYRQPLPLQPLSGQSLWPWKEAIINITQLHVSFSERNAYEFTEHSSNKCFLCLCGIFITCISSAFLLHHPI